MASSMETVPLFLQTQAIKSGGGAVQSGGPRPVEPNGFQQRQCSGSFLSFTSLVVLPGTHGPLGQRTALAGV